MKVKALAQNALLLLISTVVGLAALEFAVRLLFPQFDPSGQVKFVELADGMTMGEPGKSARQFKNTGDYDVRVQFNSIGFRDTKSFRDAKEDAIFVAGDSFSFGWGVEEHERYSNILEEYLKRPVFNISIPGDDFNGYEDHIRYAESNGARIGTLLIGVCLENDIIVYRPDESRKAGTRPPASPPRPRISQVDLMSVKSWMRDNSAAYFLATSLIHSSGTLTALGARLGLIIPNLEAVQRRGIPSEDAFNSSVKRLRSLVGSRDAAVLVIPSRQLWVGNPEDRMEHLRVHRELVSRLRNSGLLVVDPRERFEEGGDPLRFHFKNDGHWNREAHRIAAELLFKALEDRRAKSGPTEIGRGPGQVRPTMPSTSTPNPS